MVLFLIIFYDVCTMFHKIIELTHYIDNIFFTYDQTGSKHKTVKWWFTTNVYTYYLYSFMWIFIITFFDVRIKYNNPILQCSDLKCTYMIRPLQINYKYLHPSNRYFSKCDLFPIIFASTYRISLWYHFGGISYCLFWGPYSEN